MAFFLVFFLRQAKKPIATLTPASAATPPTVPPAIAATFDFELAVDVDNTLEVVLDTA